MYLYSIKVVLSAVLIVIISEVSKRDTLIGGILASLPLVSVLAMIWLYVETKNIEKVSDFATSVLWMVIPSLALFFILPVLLKQGYNFYGSLLVGCGLTAAAYFLMVILLRKAGIEL
jgi:hypothetical protein